MIVAVRLETLRTKGIFFLSNPIQFNSPRFLD